MSYANVTIDDADSRVVYSNNPVWDTAVWGEQDPQPFDDTNHSTVGRNASATLTFDGTAVYVYGYKSSDHGFRDISIDGAVPTRCDGKLGAQGSRALVYSAENLSPGTHKLTITNAGEEGEFLNLDYFVVTQSPKRNSSPPAAVIAGVVVGVAVLALLLTAFCSIRSRRKRRRQQQRLEQEKRANEEIIPWRPNNLAIPATANVSTLSPQPPSRLNPTHQSTLTDTPLPVSHNHSAISYSPSNPAGFASTSPANHPAMAQPPPRGAVPLTSSLAQEHSQRHFSHQSKSSWEAKLRYNGSRPSIEGAGSSSSPIPVVRQNTVVSVPGYSPPPYSQNQDHLPV
ncbi:hypothetical protein CPB86DRAFT_778985 [Serendipita vermifera]|nr:hypothetical protein CPB86DRAFT_778985 [Serendipita vermifera]